MKKIFTLLLIAFGLQLCVLAQSSFVVYDPNGEVINSEASLTVPTRENNTTQYKITIKNSSNEVVTARISKRVTQAVEGSSNTMCSPTTQAGSGACSLSERTAAFTLAAGETSGVADLDFEQGPNGGTSVITYTVYNENNSDDYIFFTITFSTTTSVPNNNLSNFAVYPNPANSNFTISYDFNSKSYVEIYNVLGKVVARVNPKSGSNVNIDCSKWEKGYYFCRLYNENKVEKTVKLVVIH